MQMKSRLAVLLAACLFLAASGLTQNAPTARPAPPAGFPDLVGGLKATPGCLGVETARTGSGKNVIFAWFENKKAALAWFHSPTHQQLMKLISPDYKTQEKPMADVPDDGGPILAIASITLTGPQTPENPLPFKQIAIELYRPLTGGLSIGGSFAPEGMKVPQRGSDRPAKK